MNSQTRLQSNLGSRPHHNGTDKEPHTTGERHHGAESAKQTLEPDPVSTGVGESNFFSMPSSIKRTRTFPSNDGRTTYVTERNPPPPRHLHKQKRRSRTCAGELTRSLLPQLSQ